MITEVSGSYFGTDSGQYGFYKQEVLSYMNADDTASVFKKQTAKMKRFLIVQRM